MQTYDEILKRMQNKFEELSGYCADDASDIGIRLKVLAGEIFSAGSYADWLKRQMFVQTAQDRQLDYHAQQRGIDRKKATKAEGLLFFYLAQSSDTDLLIPKGTVCSTQGKNPVRVFTTQDVILKKGIKGVFVAAQAADFGAAGNVAKDSVTVIVTPPAGISNVNNPNPFTGGSDEESDELLRARILDSIKNIPCGTNIAFYKQAAQSIDGVYSASVDPKARGLGTVDVYIGAKASAPGSDLIARVSKFIQAAREVNVDVKIMPAQLRSVSIYAGIKVLEGYDFETVSALCSDAIKAYFGTLGVGEDVRLSKLGEVFFHVEGVADYQFDNNRTNDSIALKSQLHVIKDIVLTQREET